MMAGNWKITVELIGISAIVASLIFVGLQMQQDREIATSATYSTLVESTSNIAELVERNADIWEKGLDGVELSATERIRFLAIARVVQVHFANVYIRWLRIGPGNPDYVTQTYAYALHVHPGLRAARDEQRLFMNAGGTLDGREFSSAGMERNVDRMLQELTDTAIPTEKSYVFW